MLISCRVRKWGFRVCINSWVHAIFPSGRGLTCKPSGGSCKSSKSRTNPEAFSRRLSGLFGGCWHRQAWVSEVCCPVSWSQFSSLCRSLIRFFLTKVPHAPRLPFRLVKFFTTIIHLRITLLSVCSFPLMNRYFDVVVIIYLSDGDQVLKYRAWCSTIQDCNVLHWGIKKARESSSGGVASTA